MDKNILIAEFMGIELADANFPSDGYWFDLRLPMFNNSNYTEWADTNEGKIRVPVSALCYHESWDWLMPVVEKIENIEDNRFLFQISTRQGFYAEVRERFSYETKIEDAWGKTRIEAVYNTCVEFIKWYNEDNSKLKF